VLAHYRAGDQRAAITAYERARQVLQEQIGVEPGPELRHLLTMVLEQDPRLDWQPARNPRPSPRAAPAPPTSLVGRGRELADLLDLLGRRRVVVATGFAGVGKSALAAEAARAAAGVAWLVSLAAANAPEDLVPLVAEAMGVAITGPDPVGQLADHLEDASGLLVLDGCEHLSDAVARLVAAVVAQAPTGRVLATSRIELDIPGAFRFLVAPLTVGTADAIRTGACPVPRCADRP
jgi:hypothetical protein